MEDKTMPKEQALKTVQAQQDMQRVISNGQPLTIHNSASPMQQLMAAASQGLDLSVVEKALELQDRWERNEARKAYFEDLAKFKATPMIVEKNKGVSFATRGGTTSYTHATLDEVVATVTGPLSDNGFGFYWNMENDLDAQKVTVTCVLSHRLGHTEQVSLSSRADNSGGKNAIQADGSAIAYLQRYTLLAITGAATRDADDDGHSTGSAANSPAQSGKQQAQPAQPPTRPMSEAMFERGWPQWVAAVHDGSRTPEAIIKNLGRTAVLSEEQIEKIASIKQPASSDEWLEEYTQAEGDKHADIQL